MHAVRTFTGRGVGFAETPASYYDMLAERLGATDMPVDALRPLGILVDRDHWGQMYQIFAKSMHIRRTFFLELIERHGAAHLRHQQHPRAVRGEGARARRDPRHRRHDRRLTARPLGKDGTIREPSRSPRRSR